MPGKIVNMLGDEKVAQMIEELRALSARPTYAQIIEHAKKYGVTISNEAAKTFRVNTFEEHLARIARGREKGASILAAVKGGAHALDAIEEAAAVDLLDQYTDGEEVNVAGIVKVAAQLRASIEQRKDRDRNDADLARKLADSESKRTNDATRIAVLEQRLTLSQLDAAKAVLKHANEIKLVIADKSLAGPKKTERVRKILFGEKPADFKPVTTTGAHRE